MNRNPKSVIIGKKAIHFRLDVLKFVPSNPPNRVLCPDSFAYGKHLQNFIG
jgi:hypothetical protein